MTAKIVNTYNYTDESGVLLFQVCRTEPKGFIQRRPDGNGDWIWNLDGVRRVLYRLPELLKSSKQDWLFLPEGEKDVDRLIAEGLEATCNPMGAGKWRDEYSEFLRGRLVAILPDNDDAGLKHSKRVAASLYGLDTQVKIIELPGLKPPKKDISDWFDNGGTVPQLLELVDKAELYQPPPASEKPATRFNLTDVGNAERLAERHGKRLRYVWMWDRWLYYDGKRWNTEIGNEMAQRLTIKTVRSIIFEAQDKPDEVRAILMKWSLASESTHRINSMLAAARAIEGLSAYPKDFDTDPMLFNVLNGTINLQTGKLRSHNSADFITKLSPVEYDPEAKLALWDEVIETATGGDRKLQDFLQTAVGYSLTGKVDEEKMFFVHGPTATSKSTVLEAIKATLGEYAATSDFETFLKKPPQGSTLRNDIACLAGKRFVASTELDEGRKLAEGLIKILTGGDTVKARFLYHEHFDFMPQFKLWLAANHAPRVSDNDAALWRRILRIPFENIVPEDERRPSVKVTLRNPEIAGPAILAWAVKGCMRWQTEGLKIPGSVEKATESYRFEQDPLREFCDECCVFDPVAYVPVAEMRASYEQFAKENGVRFTLSQRGFNERIEARGCRRRPMRIFNDLGTEQVIKCWSGVTLSNNLKKLEPELIQDEIPF